MKKNFLKAAVMTLVAGGAIFGTVMVSDAANVRILPVDINSGLAPVLIST